MSGERAQPQARGTADGHPGADGDRPKEHEHIDQLLVVLSVTPQA
jgi:hypothetical protein